MRHASPAGSRGRRRGRRSAKCARLISAQQAPATGSGPGPSSPYSAPTKMPDRMDCASSVALGQRHRSQAPRVCSLAPGAATFLRPHHDPLAVLHLLDAHQVVAVVAGAVEAQLALDGVDPVRLEPGRRSPCRRGSWSPTTPASRICQAVYDAAACVSTDGVGQAGLGRALVVELDELGGARVVGERRLLLEDRHRQRVLRLGRRRPAGPAPGTCRSAAAARSRSSSSRRAAGCLRGRWRRPRRSRAWRP